MTGRGVDVEWRPRAAGLASRIGEALALRNLDWADAVRNTPRHLFVPRFYRQNSGGQWTSIDSDDPTWLDSVYADVPLVTALLPDEHGRQVVVSSSTKPALMLRMLDALDIEPGHRVLEIGTGTGYNAALLCHHARGETSNEAVVVSVDIGADLVDTARARLLELGHSPILVTGDGIRGVASHAPYQRIIATCSVPAIPWDWAEQLDEHGQLLADLKIGLHAGNLVLLRRYTDRLEGRFLPKRAGFMSARARDAATPIPRLPGPPPELTGHTSTRLDPDPWTALVPWFLAQAGRVPIIRYSRSGQSLDTHAFTAADGSHCEIGPADSNGTRQVNYGGTHALWANVEDAHHEWHSHDQPGWERLGLTITPDGAHRLWLDTPDTTLRQLPGRASREK